MVNDHRPVALLIQPPVYDFALYDLYLKPYGLLRVGRWLADGGYDVRFVNGLDYRDVESERALGAPKRRGDGTGKFFRQPVDKPSVLAAVPRVFARYGILPSSLKRRIAAARPDLVLIATSMTYWYPGVREAVRSVRSIHGSVPVIAGGVYATLLPDHCLRVCEVDAAVRGEPWEQLRRELGSRGLPVPRSGPAAAVLEECEVWRDAGVVKLNDGCPYACKYCASQALGNRFRPGAAGAAFCSIRRMNEIHGTRRFAFYDDALLVAKEQSLLPFLNQVVESGLDLRFAVPNALHAEHVDREAAELMRRAGFSEVRLGFESASESFHRSCDGKVTLQKTGEAIDHLKTASFDGSQIMLYVLAGLPAQSAEEVEWSVRLASEFGVRLSIAEYSPVPGSAFWPASCGLSQFPLADEPLCHNNSLFPLQSSEFSVARMEALKRLARSSGPA